MILHLIQTMKRLSNTDDRISTIFVIITFCGAKVIHIATWINSGQS
jgi:hypothetical protein